MLSESSHSLRIALNCGNRQIINNIRYLTRHFFKNLSVYECTYCSKSKEKVIILKLMFRELIMDSHGLRIALNAADRQIISNIRYLTLHLIQNLSVHESTHYLNSKEKEIILILNLRLLIMLSENSHSLRIALNCGNRQIIIPYLTLHLFKNLSVYECTHYLKSKEREIILILNFR